MPLEVLAVLICMGLVMSRVTVNWGDAFRGFIPSKELFGSGSIYTCMYFLYLRTISDRRLSCGGAGCHRHATRPVPWISPRYTGSTRKRLGDGFAKIPRDFVFALDDIVTARDSVDSFCVQLEKTVQCFPLGRDQLPAGCLNTR